VGTNSGAFSRRKHPADRPGRKPIPSRKVLDGALWILNTGAQWHMLPQYYPNYKTVHRRFQQWCRSEVLRHVLTDLANSLREAGTIDERESFIDATFASAKGGGDQIGKTKRGKGVKIMAIVDRHGLRLAVSTHAGNHHEVTLVQLSFDFYMIEAKPENLIGDGAYDSDPLDAQLREQGIEMISPHKSNRTKRKTQDGQRLRRYEVSPAISRRKCRFDGAIPHRFSPKQLPDGRPRIGVPLGPANSLKMIERVEFQQALITFAETDVFTLGGEICKPLIHTVASLSYTCCGASSKRHFLQHLYGVVWNRKNCGATVGVSGDSTWNSQPRPQRRGYGL
jgi:transposase